MTNLKQWFDELESLAVGTVNAAKKAAGAFDTSIWMLPSGKYIAMSKGQPVPDGSTRVAHRIGTWTNWRTEQPSEM